MRYELNLDVCYDRTTCEHCGTVIGQGSWYEQCSCTEELGTLLDQMLDMTSEEYQED